MDFKLNAVYSSSCSIRESSIYSAYGKNYVTKTPLKIDDLGCCSLDVYEYILSYGFVALSKD